MSCSGSRFPLTEANLQAFLDGGTLTSSIPAQTDEQVDLNDPSSQSKVKKLRRPRTIYYMSDGTLQAASYEAREVSYLSKNNTRKKIHQYRFQGIEPAWGSSEWLTSAEGKEQGTNEELSSAHTVLKAIGSTEKPLVSGEIPWIRGEAENGSISWKLIKKIANLPAFDNSEDDRIIVSWKSPSSPHGSASRGLLNYRDLEMLSISAPEERVCALVNPMWREILSDIRKETSKLSDDHSAPQGSCSLNSALKQARKGPSASEPKVVSWPDDLYEPRHRAGQGRAKVARSYLSKSDLQR